MIVYTPIDIPVRIPDKDLLKNFIMENYITNLESTYGYTSLLASVITRNKVLDWRDAHQIFADHTEENVYYAPGVQELFPELIEFVYKLPFKEIYGAVLNLHIKDLPLHRDEIMNLGSLSPERYNVLLTSHYGEESFFISKGYNSKKFYPTILKDYPAYAFNNNDTYHGADKVLDDRIILICAGELDNEKHKQLIEHSSEKFKDYVIRF